MKWIIENENGLSFEKTVKLYPVEHHYEKPGEKPYIKYGCPVCEMCGLELQVHQSDTHCPTCGVNLLWK